MKIERKAIQLFIDMYRFENRILTREEFMDEGYSRSHYYRLKKDFLENLDTYMGKERD